MKETLQWIFLVWFILKFGARIKMAYKGLPEQKPTDEVGLIAAIIWHGLAILVFIKIGAFSEIFK